ncbi:MAG: S41 family peptidase [Defluviitaleaceae bacterium]|nr:S41 family peptidase [Defluviitaleaceae bacterium]
MFKYKYKLMGLAIILFMAVPFMLLAPLIPVRETPRPQVAPAETLWHPPPTPPPPQRAIYFLDHTALYEERVAVHRFNTMSREDMLYDFEHMMGVLEENWPFFNLSVSANGVDVRQRADIVRALLHDPATPIRNPIDFLYLLQTYFFGPIGQLGHLSAIRSHELFFSWKESALLNMEWHRNYGTITQMIQFQYDRFTSPEMLMFYSRLRDMGRGVPPPLPLVGGEREAVMEFDSLEPGRVAYMRIHSMMGIWHDPPSLTDPRMFHYERLMYDFYNGIEGYGHLIIDLRGNRGGMTPHFSTMVMPHFLRAPVRLPAYVFYMDGYYANLAREVYCVAHNFLRGYDRLIFEMRYLNRQVTFAQPLPYLDTEIGLVHAFASGYRINPRLHYFGTRPSFGTRRTAFDIVHFHGKIWLLIDEYTASAAEGAAAILKYGGIATVVGAPTMGVMGTGFEPVVFTTFLPNTGILIRFDVAYYTDSYGRPLQGYGIQPHYHNRPGMDALETVLAMIAEGSLHTVLMG